MSTLFVGLGKMGVPMARNYAAQHAVVLYDVGPSAADLAAELRATALSTLKAIPGDVDTVILMLPNSVIVESVLDGDDSGLLHLLPPGSLVIDMSSSVPASTRALAEQAAAAGIAYVDAPVSGGVAKASSGELAVMVGGAADAVERALPHIEPMADSVIHVGPSGAGHAAKALNNMLSATNVAAAAEVLAIATLFGIAPATMVAVVNASTGRSQATKVKYPQHILTGTYQSGFAMNLMVKDLGIARDLAAALDVDSPVTATACEVARAAQDGLPGENLDHTELARWYELQNNISFRSRPVAKPNEGQQ
ncbi:NAD(P)-dependent oxidoreductase [Streptomyces sp. SID8352]|uniref:NAD(P)-dependent oxidoreductase n=1 Tax=Streptomyces sp. SID8352 TaxID=2690338 RepID=UPI00136B38E9|nr:NAD(P)-dependent oxidoreductase [Streptomyces sp. SID8352]MYU21997.1 NAD-binding protein [Streptomyces sp. SID8352]